MKERTTMVIIVPIVPIVPIIAIIVVVVMVMVVALIPVRILMYAPTAFSNSPGGLKPNPSASAVDSSFAIRHVPITFLRCLNNWFADVLAFAGNSAFIQTRQ